MTMRETNVVFFTLKFQIIFSKISLLENEPKYFFNKDNKLIKYLQSTFIIEEEKETKLIQTKTVPK